MESNTYILLSYYNYCVLKANHINIKIRELNFDEKLNLSS